MNRKYIVLFIFSFSVFLPLKSQIIAPAEHEKKAGILLTWDYQESHNTVTADLCKNLQPNGQVWIVYYPGQVPYDTSYIKQYLFQHGVSDYNFSFVPAWTETFWIRDYGPFSVYNQGNEYHRMILDAGYSAYGRPKDDSVPAQLAGYWNIEHQDISLEFEGGNLLFDGLGRGVTSSRILSQNPGLTENQVADTLKKYFGLYDVQILEALENCGGGIWAHVDMYIKFLDHEKILVSQYPDTVPDYDIIENNAAQLDSLTNAFGNSYEIIRIPAPVNDDGTYPVSQNEEMRTYTNSVTFNGCIVVPSYDQPFDSVAYQVYSRSMPGYDIRMVDARNITPSYGSLHCITKEMVPPQLLRIIFNPVRGILEYSNEFTVNCRIQSSLDEPEVRIFCRKNQETIFQQTEFQATDTGFVALLNQFEPQDTIYYYLQAIAGNDTIHEPFTAEKKPYSFWFAEVPDTIDDKTPLPVGNQHQTTISPNPSDGEFYIMSDMLKADVFLYNMKGNLYYSQLNQKFPLHLDLKSCLHAGIYFIMMKNSDCYSVKKIIVY